MTIYFVIWYLTGLAGCILGSYTSYLKGDDLTIIDVVLCIFCSMFGLFILFVALSYYLNNNPINPIVIIKGKK